MGLRIALYIRTLSSRDSKKKDYETKIGGQGPVRAVELLMNE
jgi:hypothetical protein